MTITVLFTVGYVILGLATYRAAVLPRSVGTLLVIGAVARMGFEQVGALLLGSDALWAIGPVLMGAGMAWLGYSLWSLTPGVQAVRVRTPRIVTGTHSIV